MDIARTAGHVAKSATDAVVENYQDAKQGVKKVLRIKDKMPEVESKGHAETIEKGNAWFSGLKNPMAS